MKAERTVSEQDDFNGIELLENGLVAASITGATPEALEEITAAWLAKDEGGTEKTNETSN